MKKAAPGKESGLQNMPADYSRYTVETHEPFILNTLLPSIAGQADKTQHPASVVALACFMSMATILQAKGLNRSTLMSLIDSSRLDLHDAPEVLQ